MADSNSHHVRIHEFQGHPLKSISTPSLADIAEYQVITYQEGFTGRARIERAFAHAGVVPNIVMSALEAGVIKSYVELGLGIGLIASVAYDETRDSTLHKLGCSICARRTSL